MDTLHLCNQKGQALTLEAEIQEERKVLYGQKKISATISPLQFQKGNGQILYQTISLKNYVNKLRIQNARL